MPRRRSSSRKGKSLYPFVGAGFLGLLVLSFMIGRMTGAPKPSTPVPARRAPAVSRPVPAPVPPRPAAVPSPSSAAPALTFPRGQGKIAIVLDDWGYTMKQLPALSSIRQPVTLAVLPGLEHSADVARAARAEGHEVILHMPMEAVDPNAPRENSTLLVGMSQGQVVQKLSSALETIPSVSGISNHQGSKATADPALMEAVLKEAKRRKLYFLDSLTGKSVCPQVAQKLKVPFAQRAVFLDNEQSPPEIQQRLRDLALAASKHGQAIGIGHDRPVMLAVLQKAAPALEKAGYTLVPVSELTEVPDSRSRN